MTVGLPHERGAETPMPGRRPAMVAGWAHNCRPSRRLMATVSSAPSGLIEVTATTSAPTATLLTTLILVLCQEG
ncbi:hypothetical protein ACFQES_14170 [Nonomuraea salmonea]|uniref:hypothetical protein n=1 Tax=Nonomuraea salmonea TaxID=46181 RepID=UPI00361574C8